MSAKTTEVLARAAGIPLCDCLVIGIKPDADVHVDFTASTIAGALLHLRLAEEKLMEAWHIAAQEHRAGLLKDEAA